MTNSGVSREADAQAGSTQTNHAWNSLAWDHSAPFMRCFEVRAEHIDALAHTNNTIYVNWCMETAWAHTTCLGLGAAEYQSLDRAMALRRAEYDYLCATRLGDTVVAGTWITGWDRRLVMKRQVQLINALTGTVVLRARLDFVCIEISSGKAKRPPPAFIDHYTPVIINP